MVAVTFSDLGLEIGKDCNQHGVISEEIGGLIKVHKDGHVERTQIVPCVTSELAPEFGVTSRDITIDKLTNIWARFYVPICASSTITPAGHGKLPLIVYFHGGGFCVGSVAWSCYHEFLASLVAKTGCLIMSINYRLAPENPLPAAYEDGIKAINWLKNQALVTSNNPNCDWWRKQCKFSDIFIGGDSAGANIAYQVVSRLGGACEALRPLTLKGIILIQPFFGGEQRTNSEKYLLQSPRSALSLSSSDTYWRLALPNGANRDHPWCNPTLLIGSKRGADAMNKELIMQLPIFVSIAELDILRDRNLEFVAALENYRSSSSTAGGRKRQVEHVVHKCVGHAFQVLSKSQVSQNRTLEMMSQIQEFIASTS